MHSDFENSFTRIHLLYHANQHAITPEEIQPEMMNFEVFSSIWRHYIKKSQRINDRQLLLYTKFNLQFGL